MANWQLMHMCSTTCNATLMSVEAPSFAQLNIVTLDQSVAVDDGRKVGLEVMSVHCHDQGTYFIRTL